MKKIVVALSIGIIALSSCDKVENPYPNIPSTELDYSLYPDGDSAHYTNNAWPTFTANTNVNRNVMIEDFTGHRCVFCPNAAAAAEAIELANLGRVFVSTVHTGPDGIGAFQALDAGNGFVEDFTCPEGLEIGNYFGNDWAGSPFLGNPYGAVSRYNAGNGYPVQTPADWSNTTNSLISTNDLKVNLQTATNYYPSTRGLFVHVEAEILDAALTNELRIVVQLHEDSMVAPQKMPDNSTNTSYVHHDIFRGCIDGRTFGQTLDVDHLEANGKYYFNYSYALPAEYDASNMHLLIYIRDAVTEEIYHVIEKHFD